MNSSPGCTGACCALLTYCNKRHDEIEALRGDPSHDPYVIDMLVPISNAEAEQRARRFLPLQLAEETEFGPETEGTFFKCRHWNEETRLCNDYASRPRMCRDFPYGAECSHGCSFRGCRGYPLNPRGVRNLAVLSYTAGRICEIEKGIVSDLGVA